MTQINAFAMARPRGIAAPSKAPTPVSLAPRATGSITIENREKGQASVDKRRAISPWGTK